LVFFVELLHKDPDKRLGNGDDGIDDIKSHPWFEEIDFGLLEARAIDPVFVPNVRKFYGKKNHEVRF
jgi:pantothenate synthetase